MVEESRSAPPGIWHRAGRQLARPEGMGGIVAGQLMSLANGSSYRLALEALEPEPTDRVLEVGFGPGLGIAALSRRVPEGHVCGLDASPTMVRRASRRNARLIAANRVDLRLGHVDELPWGDGTFDRLLAVNVAYFFDAGGAVSEIHRVLTPGGRAVFYVTDRASMASWPFATTGTHRIYDAFDLGRLLLSGGFTEGRVHVRAHRLAFGIRGLVGVAERRRSG